jgi:hypothetical protein
MKYPGPSMDHGNPWAAIIALGVIVLIAAICFAWSGV